MIFVGHFRKLFLLQDTRFSLTIAIGCALCLSLPMCEGRAQAAGLSAKDTAKAKEARQLYKAGKYEAAAEIFLRLSNDYPDMLVLTRNLGACYYYLHRPEPALSNLREYLEREQNITPEDRREVEAWIAEMEKLRSQRAAPPSSAPVVAPAPPPSTVASPSPPSMPGPTAAALPRTPATASLPAPAPVEPVQEGLDLTQKSAGQEGAAAPESSSRWWLWTGIGAVVVGGIVSIIVWRASSSPSPTPERDGTCSPGLTGCIVVGK
jgi:hypothetical protein